MFYLYPIVKGSANCDTVSGFDNSFHGMIHPSVNTRKKSAGWGGFAFFWRRSERYRVSLFIIAIFHYPAFLLRS
ncbi:hypothetical protein E1B42_13475 [Salmonella enterica subsp. enterica serovar Agona]|uniref:Uncharacterized protein n=6 Tax=Salmonella enterica TaxID=28901 RepID=A0A701B9N4_SALEN|nr:hypothetical protein SeAg_B4682 [Salmonella enterica subsp. enterica serovar Agona str. SL483]APY48334.1 hypothetical protein LFZ6_22830 [Salmonella enterica subsp. enterica serovar Borreze str. SA20041063]EAA0693199.1 hypothetical protein [Salmonella enterica subsp. enterica serovar Agona]EAA3400152.1 hypothetical protein [Salmonella enterica]EAA4418355.1 hypothetical protein [Salmonella enterica subsp. enterica serovar Oranienburg]EAA7425907.1 hypothetical protein [Salmonella enterica sub